MSDTPDIAAIRAKAKAAKDSGSSYDSRWYCELYAFLRPDAVLALCDAADERNRVAKASELATMQSSRITDLEAELAAARAELSRIEHALDDPEKTCGELLNDECNERFGLAKVRIAESDRRIVALRKAMEEAASAAGQDWLEQQLMLARVLAETATDAPKEEKS